MKILKYTAITAVLLLLSLILIRLASNSWLYPFKGGYVYQFENHATLTTTIDNHGFDWPQVSTPWDSALLKLQVSSTWLGYLFEPYIEYAVEGELYRQYFERGVNGERYLNISHVNRLDLQPGTHVALQATHLTWPTQTNDLITFDNPDLTQATILVISAHPDDAEIAAFDFYRTYPDNTYVITITAGDGFPGYHHFINLYPDLAQHYETKGKLRAFDSTTAPMLAHIPAERIANLGYFDSKTIEMYNNRNETIAAPFANLNSTGVYRQFNNTSLVPNADIPATWDNLVNDLVSIIDTIQPDIIVTPHPVVDYHNDHRYATVAIIEALQRTSVQQGHFFLYAIHHVATGADVYPFGPQNSLYSLSPWDDTDYSFYSMYSHPLTWEQQKWKIFVLDSQHDLRPGPFGYALKHSTPIFIKNALQGLNTHPYYSYYRRGIRQNELFYVLPFTHADKLIQDLT